MDPMLDAAWKQYRGWAGAARAAKAASGRDASVALSFICLSALLGSAASVPAEGNVVHRSLAVLTVAFGAAAAWYGRYILSPGTQSAWIAARAAAETIQSECYRFATKSAPYDAANAPALLKARVEAAEKLANEKGARPDAQSMQQTDKPPPPAGMTLDQYRNERIDKQKDFYVRGAKTQQEKARRTRNLTALVAFAGAVLGVIVAFAPNSGLAPFIATCTTMTTALASYGVMERHLFLAEQYTQMVSQLNWIEAADADISKIVADTEDILTAEHAAWGTRMQRLTEPPKDNAISGK